MQVTRITEIVIFKNNIALFPHLVRAPKLRKGKKNDILLYVFLANTQNHRKVLLSSCN